MDYDVERCTRLCAATGRELAEGEQIYSALVVQGGKTRRLDFAIEAWSGPPDEAIGWWRSRIEPPHKKPPQAPSDLLLEWFQGLEHDPASQDLRYVLALLLVRRRVLRLEEHEPASPGGALTFFLPRDETYHLVVPQIPSPERESQIQSLLGQILETPTLLENIPGVGDRNPARPAENQGGM